jgi:hypothetical protein
MAWVATAIIGGAVIGAVGANSAASTQADASQAATNAQQQMFNQTVSNEAPFRQGGQQALSTLDYLLGIGPNPNAQPTYSAPVSNYGGPGGYLQTTGQNGYGGPGGFMGGPQVALGGNGSTGVAQASPSNAAGGYGSLLTPFTADTFKQYSPAYQFQLQQGQQGVLNGDEASAGALSGAAQKDLMSYNQNAANTAFNNAFNQYQTQQGNIYQRLGSLAQLGQSAASNQATGASSFANGIGNSISNIGAAQAGGIVGATNSITGSINNALPYLMAGNSGSSAGALQPMSSSSLGLGNGYTVYAPGG